MDSDISSIDSEVCFYRIDSKESGIVLFGSSKEAICEKGFPEIINLFLVTISVKRVWSITACPKSIQSAIILF
ncbi:hypothetical protein BTJ40_05325 [Microbulbifer sp. A4B17]|nr:hypothetical protein BTJ40_05325 [Microbulbifer sp. A4B17]